MGVSGGWSSQEMLNTQWAQERPLASDIMNSNLYPFEGLKEPPLSAWPTTSLATCSPSLLSLPFFGSWCNMCLLTSVSLPEHPSCTPSDLAQNPYSQGALPDQLCPATHIVSLAPVRFHRSHCPVATVIRLCDHLWSVWSPHDCSLHEDVSVSLPFSPSVHPAQCLDLVLKQGLNRRRRLPSFFSWALWWHHLTQCAFTAVPRGCPELFPEYFL